MSYEIFTMPNLTVREAAIRLVAEQGVDTTLLSVTVDLGVSDAAAAYESAGDVIRRIQGTAKKDVAVEPTPGTQLLEWAQMLHSRWPVARRHLEALALWFDAPETPGDDFTPPADADAIAAAERRGERRGAERERLAVVRWLEGLRDWMSISTLASCIHGGGESDDS